MRIPVSSLLAILSLASAAALGHAQDEPASGDLRTARVSAIDGLLHARGPFDEDAEELVPNAIVQAGDEVFTDDATFAELELPQGAFLRMASATSLVVERIDEQGVEIALASGDVILSLLDGSAPAVIATAAGRVDPRRGSMVRVGSDADGTWLRITPMRGDAVVRLDGTPTIVAGGRTWRWPESTRAVGTARDAFDRWNAEREETVRSGLDEPWLSRRMVGAHELAGRGTWLLIGSDWAWRPYDVPSGWRPYAHGYWSWCGPYGWTWVSFERWGYVTSHYGRWAWHGRHGWCWHPGRAWGPAWVAWAIFGGHVGWAPCDLRGRPACTTAPCRHFDRHAWSHCDSRYFDGGGGYHRCRDCRPSHRLDPQRPARPTRPAFRDPTDSRDIRRDGIGPDGRYRIERFERDPVATAVPVPIRDPRRELRPSTVEPRPETRTPDETTRVRRPTLLDRSVRDPARVRREPWAEPRELPSAGRDGQAPAERGETRPGGPAPRPAEPQERRPTPRREAEPSRPETVRPAPRAQPVRPAAPQADPGQKPPIPRREAEPSRPDASRPAPRAEPARPTPVPTPVRPSSPPARRPEPSRPPPSPSPTPRPAPRAEPARPVPTPSPAPQPETPPAPRPRRDTPPGEP